MQNSDMYVNKETHKRYYFVGICVERDIYDLFVTTVNKECNQEHL